MITNYLPTFKVVEVNNLVGLRSGHMLAQQKAAADIATKSYGEYKFIENGIICGLNADGTIGNYDVAKHGAAMFLHYTEELNTYIDELKYFAVPVEEGVAYPRCIALYVGDSFTTNNYAGTEEGAKFAKVVGGVLTLQAAADKDSAFIVVESSLPTGEKAYEFTFYRVPSVA